MIVSVAFTSRRLSCLFRLRWSWPGEDLLLQWSSAEDVLLSPAVSVLAMRAELLC